MDSYSNKAKLEASMLKSTSFCSAASNSYRRSSSRDLLAASNDSLWSVADEEMIIVPASLIAKLCTACATKLTTECLHEQIAPSSRRLQTLYKSASEVQQQETLDQMTEADAFMSVLTLDHNYKELVGVWEQLQSEEVDLDAVFEPIGQVVYDRVLQRAARAVSRDSFQVGESETPATTSNSSNRLRNAAMRDCNDGLFELLLNQVDGNFRHNSLKKLRQETGITFNRPFALLTKMVTQHESADQGASASVDDHLTSETHARFADDVWSHFQPPHSNLADNALRRTLSSDTNDSSVTEVGRPKSLTDMLRIDLPTRSVLRRPGEWQLVDSKPTASNAEYKQTNRRISFTDFPQPREPRSLQRNRRLSYLQSAMHAATHASE